MSLNGLKTADKEMKTKESEKPVPTTNMGKFITSTLLSIFIFILCVLFGAGFLVQTDFYSQFKMTGVDVNKPPYTTDFPYENIFTKIYKDEYGRPYQKNELPYRIMRWLTYTMRFAFANNRYYLDSFLDSMGGIFKEYSGIINPLVLAFSPIITILFLLVSYCAGFVSTMIGAIKNAYILRPTSVGEIAFLLGPFFIPLIIVGLIVLFSGLGLGWGIGVIQSIMMAVFMLVLPIMSGIPKFVMKDAKDPRYANYFKKGTKFDRVILLLLDNAFLIATAILTIIANNTFKMLDETYATIPLVFALISGLAFLYNHLL